MTSTQTIANALGQFPENNLIFASQLYAERLRNEVTESAYYKTLERLCKNGALRKIAKGTYYRPKTSKYGIVPPSQKEIVSVFTEPNAGTVVGYSLYNRLRLTPQVGKTIEAYSSRLTQQTKTVSNVRLNYCNLVFTPEVKAIIHMMDVLQNFTEIQELDYAKFLEFSREFAQQYSDEAFEQVNHSLRYQKRTISFLREVLNYYGIEHNLSRYLSSLSEYKHPRMEEIHEAAHIS